MNPESSRSTATTAVRWAWACALVVCILFASGQSQVAGPDIINFDKLAHLLVFGLLATLVARAMVRPGLRWWAIPLVSLYGAGDEFRQSLTPGRFMEVADWAADTTGAIIAVTLYLTWPAYRCLLERPLFRRKVAAARPSPPATAAALAVENRLS